MTSTKSLKFELGATSTIDQKRISGTRKRSRKLNGDDQVFKTQIASLYNNERLSDVILIVGNKRYHAHKFILALGSTVFESMFYENTWQESTQQEVALVELDECVRVFPDFLKFMYTGCVELTVDTVTPILFLSDKYCLPRLSQMCSENMLRYISDHPDINRTVAWYRYTNVTGNTLLLNKCRQFMTSNCETITQIGTGIELERGEVLELLACSDLVVSDEFTLWQSIEKWLGKREKQEDFPALLREVVKAIRFYMIPPEYLVLVEKSHLFLDHKEALQDHLLAAYRHWSLLSSELTIDVEDMYRNYSSQMYGICYDLSVDYGLHEMFDSKTMNIKVPFQFATGGRHGLYKDFQVVMEYWPKGKFVSVSQGDLLNNYLALSLSAALEDIPKSHPEFVVKITYIIYGKMNGVRYAAYSYVNSFMFSKTSLAFREDRLLQQMDVVDVNSRYLIDNFLEAKLFVKIVKRPGPS